MTPALTGRLTRDGGTITDHNNWSAALTLSGRTLTATLPGGAVAFTGQVTHADGAIVCDLLDPFGMGWRISGTKDGDGYGYALVGEFVAPVEYSVPGDRGW